MPLPQFDARLSDASPVEQQACPRIGSAASTRSKFSPTTASLHPLFLNMPSRSNFPRSPLMKARQPNPLCSREMPKFIPLNKELNLSHSSVFPHQGTRAYATTVSPEDDHVAKDSTNIVSTSVLPDRMRSLFSFAYFNAMQSKAFDAIYSSNDNVVVCAPTGSGKTTCLEFAIARLMQTDLATGSYKVISPIMVLLIPR